MWDDGFRLNYVQRDELYLSMPKEPTLREIFGPPRNPRNLLGVRLMKATLSGASHVEDFARFGIPEPEVDMKEFYQR